MNHKTSFPPNVDYFSDLDNALVDILLPGHCGSLRAFTERALNIFAEYDLKPPKEDRLNLIVTAALEARNLLFAAALNEPDNFELEIFFDQFVLQCIH
jgi:hypothetical protein